MTGDPLRPLQPGDPIPTSVRTWNPLLELARTRKTPLPADGKNNHGQVQILVRNDSGSDRDRNQPLTISGTVVAPTDNLLQFRERSILIGQTPTDENAHKLAITVEPIPAGGIGRAVVSGAIAVQVDLSHEDETHARPVDGDATKLAGNSSGNLILYRPPENGVQWCVVLIGQSSSVPPCDEFMGGSISIETWRPTTGNRWGKYNVNLSLVYNDQGCLTLSAATLGTGEYIDKCCGSTSSGGSGDSCSSDVGGLHHAATCSGWNGPILAGGPYRSFKGHYHEIVSITSSLASINSGDLVTITVVWKLRDDYPYDSLNPTEACCGANHPDGGGCGRVMSVNQDGCVVTQIATIQDNPSCLRKGETYTFEKTFLVDYTGAECVSRFLQFGVGIGVINHRGLGSTLGCGAYPASGYILFNSSGSHTCNPDSYWMGPWGDYQCDPESSSSSGPPPSSSSGVSGGTSSEGSIL